MKLGKVIAICSVLLLGCSQTPGHDQASAKESSSRLLNEKPAFAERGKWGWPMKSNREREQEKREQQAFRNDPNRKTKD
ncbi:hypothetical protein [Paraglaciecola aestuariivivens]